MRQVKQLKEAIEINIKMLFSFFLKLLNCINLNVIGLEHGKNGLYFDGSLIKSPVSMHDNGM